MEQHFVVGDVTLGMFLPERFFFGEEDELFREGDELAQVALLQFCARGFAVDGHLDEEFFFLLGLAAFRAEERFVELYRAFGAGIAAD